MSGEIALKDYGNREAWLASRTTALGASETAALFNAPDGSCLSPYTTPYKLWLEKTGQLEPQELTGEWVELGNILEPAVAEIYVRRTGRRVWQGGPFCVAEHAKIPFLRATPDRWVIEAPDRDTPGLVQIKTCNAFKAHDWDEGPPDFIQVQVQTEMAVTGRDWNSLAVLVGGGSAFRSIDVERNDEFIAELEEQVRWFWDLVQRRVQPQIDASPRTLEAIKRLHPQDNGETVRLPEEAVEWVSMFEAAKETAKQAKDPKTEAEAKLRAAIGAATFGELPDGRRLSLKTTERSGYTPKPVAPCTYRVLRLEKATTKARKR